MSIYRITGPTSFGTGPDTVATSAAGMASFLYAAQQQFGIAAGYSTGQAIVSSATFTNASLASLGFTTLGPIGTWSIDGTQESIQLLTSQSPTPVPAPWPLLGFGAALGWSRRLRQRSTRHPLQRRRG